MLRMKALARIRWWKSTNEKERHEMKVAVIGGGSTYTPELISGFLERINTFPISELWLMDISQERLDIVGKFAQRMVIAKGMPFKVVLSTDQRSAIEGAAYVITQLRVGMMQARRADEYLGRRHGLVGQETTGVGGMANALRTIPVILNVAKDIRQLVPEALLVNFTNPSGLVTEALFRYAPDIKAAGVCNVPITTQMEILEGLEEIIGEPISFENTQLITLGLNHLSWHRGFMFNGKDMWEIILQRYLTDLKTDIVTSSQESEWDVQTIEALGMLPNYYLRYYYHTDRILAAQEKWPPSRGEEVINIEAKLLQQYAETDRTEPPADLMKRGGAYYSTMATQLLNAHYNDTGEIHVVNVRHAGAVPGWPEDWVLEMPCKINRNVIHPLPADPLPGVCYGLLTHVKMYELLTVEAAVHGDRRSAYQALLAHPLGPKADKVKTVLEDMLNTHRDYLPQFR
jgi:6-phospho-beta-glucosidase